MVIFEWFALSTNTWDIQVLSALIRAPLTIPYKYQPHLLIFHVRIRLRSHPRVYDCILQYPIGGSRPPGTNTRPLRCHCRVDPNPNLTHPHQLIRRPEPPSNIEGPTGYYPVQSRLAFFRTARRRICTYIKHFLLVEMC